MASLSVPESDSVVPRKMSATDSHYEALRKAYDERVKSLSKKLRNYSSAGSAPGSAACSTAHPSPADSAARSPDDGLLPPSGSGSTGLSKNSAGKSTFLEQKLQQDASDKAAG